MRAAIYLRQSKDVHDDKLAVTRQREDCVKLCQAAGWTAWTEYTDNDCSATRGDRPAYRRMLADIRSGAVGAVVCWDLDRLHRRPVELEEFIDLANEKSLALATVGGETDLSTDGGRLFARIKGAVARSEIERKSARQKRANQQHRASGKWSTAGQRPFGYTKEGEPFEPEAAMVRRAARDVLARTSLRSISRDWNARGVTTTRGSQWTNLQLRRVLMNPTNAAMVVHEGKAVGPGTWEPLIDADTHRALVALLSDPSRRPALSFERRHMGSGVYLCGECGARMYGTYPHGRGRTMVYVCRPSSHVARLAAPLDDLVEQVVLGHLAGNGIAGQLRRTEDSADLDALRQKRDALATTKDQLASLLRRGILDVAGVERESRILAGEIAGIDTVLADAAQDSPAAMLLDDGEDPEVLADGELLRARWTRASPDIKGKIIGALFDVVVHRAGRGKRGFDPDLIKIIWKKPL